MKFSNYFLSLIICAISAESYAADYWFSRGVADVPATRNWSDLNNWSTAATAADGWNTSKSTVVPGADSLTADKVTFGDNSGYNGTDTTVSSINLDTDATLGLFTVSGSNVPLSISSDSSKALTLKAALQATKDPNQSPTAISTSTSGEFTFNTDVTLYSSAGTADSGATYTSLWTKVVNNKGTLTFADGTTLSTVANQYTGSAGDMRFYCAYSASEAQRNVINLNAKIVSGAQFVFGTSGTWNSYAAKYVIGGSESNQMSGTLIVENYAELRLAKKGSAIAFGGSRLQILTGRVFLDGNDQIAKTTQLAFSQSSTSATAAMPYFSLNGHSQQIKNMRFEAASWISKGATLLPVIDFGSNSDSQTFTFGGFEFGTLIAKADADTKKGLIIADCGLVISNYTIGDDHVISTVQLSSKLLSSTIADVEGKTWLDFLIFKDYDMDEYFVKEIANGSNWEYVLVAVPEPAQYAAIFGIFAMAIAFLRRRK